MVAGLESELKYESTEAAVATGGAAEAATGA